MNDLPCVPAWALPRGLCLADGPYWGGGGLQGVVLIHLSRIRPHFGKRAASPNALRSNFEGKVTAEETPLAGGPLPSDEGNRPLLPVQWGVPYHFGKHSGEPRQGTKLGTHFGLGFVHHSTVPCLHRIVPGVGVGVLWLQGQGNHP